MVQVEAGTDTTWHVDVAEGTSEVDASTVGAAAREVDAAMAMRFGFHREEGVRILTSYGAKVKKSGSESEHISRKLSQLKITDQAAASPLTCDRGERRRPPLTRKGNLASTCPESCSRGGGKGGAVRRPNLGGVTSSVSVDRGSHDYVSSGDLDSSSVSG